MCLSFNCNFAESSFDDGGNIALDICTGLWPSSFLLFSGLCIDEVLLAVDVLCEAG